VRFALVSLGCKVNRVESDSLAAALLEQGHGRCGLPDADCVIVNTCTVTGEADKKARKAVRRSLRDNRHAPVYVTGCAAALDPGTYRSLDPRVAVEPDKGRALALICERFGPAPGERGPTPQASGASEASGQPVPPARGRALRAGEGFPTRIGVKVQDGCDGACSYCIVPAARGPALSRPFDEVLEEVRALAQAGVKEIVLTGINLGSYRFTEGGLAEALEGLLSETETTRFRLSSIEPEDLDEALVGLVATSQGRVCRHLHLPLQSGSSKVLAEMARPYDAQGFLARAEALYAQIPGLALTTDAIVGFPGETDSDFDETLGLVGRLRFSKVHVFPYSQRKGTPAAARGDQVSPEAKAARAKQLTALAERLRRADYESRRGREELVVAEGRGRGMTESYYRIGIPRDIAPGTLFPFAIP